LEAVLPGLLQDQMPELRFTSVEEQAPLRRRRESPYSRDATAVQSVRVYMISGAEERIFPEDTLPFDPTQGLYR
jgi:hypothetical protein